MANEKFCGSCGAKMSAEAGFCPVCGAAQAAAPVVDNSVNETAQALGEAEVAGGATQAGLDPEKIKKYLPLAGIGAAVIAIIIIAVAVIINLTKWTKIDPEELCRITYEGLEGSAVPEASFAFDEYTTFYIDEYVDYGDVKNSDIIRAAKKLSMSKIKEIVKDEGAEMSDFEKHLKEEYKGLKTSKYLSLDEDDLLDAFDKAKDEDEAVEMKEALLDCIEFKVDFNKKKDKLKNGDKLKVKVDYDEDDLKEYNIKLTSDSFEVKVEGLLKGEELDIFKDLTVKFEGMDGDGDASISEETCSDFVKENFDFYISSRSYDLSNGDSVIVYGYFVGEDYNYDYDGYVDKENNVCYLFDMNKEQTFTVSGLQPLEEVDVFEYIELQYEGTAPSVSLKLVWKEDTPDYIRDNVSVTYDSWDIEVADGNTFVAEAYAYSAFQNSGYKLKETQKTYTIDLSGIERYAEAGDVTKDSFSKILDDGAKVKADELVNTWSWLFENIGTIESIKSVNFKTAFFMYNNDQSTWSTHNRFVRIYEVKCTHDNGGSGTAGTFYIAAYVEDVTVPDGLNAEELYIKYSISDVYDVIVDELGTSNDEFTVTELK